MKYIYLIYWLSLFLLIFGYKPSEKKQLATFDIEDFGAVADGVTDNYYPFKLAAAFASANANTTINFSSGTYFIAKYRTTKNDTTNHIMWNDCIGLKLIGVAGTVISMNGTFFRPVDWYTSDCAPKSYTTGLSPFMFDNCFNTEIRNMEITGNVQNTTRAPGIDADNPSVTEGSSIMLRFTRCDSVVVDNMYLHHAESDGMMVSGDRINGIWINSNRFHVSNVLSYNNARQGMSIGGLTNGTFRYCRFDSSGFVGGTYGRNDPSAGVDIEPGALHYVDSVFFYECWFKSNHGGEFLASAPDYVSNIRLLKCSVIVTGNESPQAITMLGRYSKIDSSYLSVGLRDIKITNSAKPGSTIQITNSTINSTGNFITTTSSNFADSIYIYKNQLTFLPNTMTTTFFQLQTSNLRFLNNTISISPAALASRPLGNHCVVQNAIISCFNIFPVGCRTSYTGTGTVCDP